MAKTDHKPIICFKEVVRDGIKYIDVTIGRVKATKKELDTVAWHILNQTSKPLGVALVDFYASEGGTPFKTGLLPAKSARILAGAVGDITTDTGGTTLNADGDVATYKYTVLVTLDDPASANAVWLLARDPEMDIDI